MYSLQNILLITFTNKKAIGFCDNGSNSSLINYSNIFCDQEYFLSMTLNSKKLVHILITLFAET